MPNLQPLLVPCKGTLVDLHAVVDPTDSKRLQIWWGTAVLQTVPRDRESPVFRIVACLLLNLNFRIGLVAKTLGVFRGTLRQWQKAFNAGQWDLLRERFHGPGAPKKLRPDVETFIRYNYRQACARNGGTMPYGFSKELADLVRGCWPDQQVCSEVLRKLFRDAAPSAAAAVEKPTVEQAVPHTSEPSAGQTASEDTLPAAEPQNPNDGQQEQPDEQTVEDSVTDYGRDNSGALQAASPEPAVVEHSCDSHRDDASGKQVEHPASPPSPTAKPARAKVGPHYWPILAADRSLKPLFTPHAGFFLLAEGFDRAFGHLDPILRQTGAQVLLGAVNQEQSKTIVGKDLQQIFGKIIRDSDYQRRCLDAWNLDNDLLEVYRGNLAVVPLDPLRDGVGASGSAVRVVIVYCDTHHEPYTGKLRYLLGWNNADKKVEASLALEYVHTENGQPLFAGHFDNFYDCRMRFMRMREQLRALLGAEVKIVWVFDRGYWGIDFLTRLAGELGDGFIIWQKGYDGKGWDLPCTEQGSFSITRQGNRADDRRIGMELSYRRQAWKPEIFSDGRRLIVQVQRGDTRTEVAIVCHCFGLPERRVITAMFGRFGAQECNFSYGGRHFGYNELTSRAFDFYRDVADQLEDRQVDSRAYKAKHKEREQLRKDLAAELFTLDGMPPVSLAKLDARTRTLRNRRDELEEQVAKLEPTLSPDDSTIIGRLSNRIAKLTGAFSDLDCQRKQAEQRHLHRQQCDELRAKLECAEEELKQTRKTESRLAALIEQRYVRPDMRRKALVDAVRITAHNVFIDIFRDFRTGCDDFRDDHQVLRALTHSPGLIVPHPDRLDIYLVPALDRQPGQWARIDTCLAQCAARIEARFGLPVRFHTRAPNNRMVTSLLNAKRRADTS